MQSIFIKNRRNHTNLTTTWEQRKVGDIVKSHNAGIYISKENYGSGVNIIGVGNIYDSDCVDGEIYRFAPVDDERFILDENDLIYGESSLVPEGIARTMYVTKKGSGTAFAWHTRRVKIDTEICNSHIATLELNYKSDVRNYLMKASTQTALTGMTTEGFFGATLSFPTLQEQEKISSLFTNLDNLITLHQRKYSLLFIRTFEILKEACFFLNVNAWEQRELKELASFAKGSGYAKTDIKEQGTPLILYGRLYTKYETKIDEVDTFAEPKKGSVYSKGTEVVVPASGESADDIARASFVAKSGILLGGDLNIIYPNEMIKPTFLALSISNGEQQKSLAKKAQGKSVVHLHNSDLETVNIVYPTIAEQTKIGRYFLDLDNLITLHQRKPFQRKNGGKNYVRRC